MNLVLAITGATGACVARMLLDRSPWPVTLVASKWGKDIYEREVGPFKELSEAATVYEDDDLLAPISSGTVETAGMVILPCSANTLAKVAAGIADTLITRAAHCHLKERRKLVLCVRESPWSTIDLDNARKASAAGAIVMPISPPFYLCQGRPPQAVSLSELMSGYVDHVLSLLGHQSERTWETVR